MIVGTDWLNWRIQIIYIRQCRPRKGGYIIHIGILAPPTIAQLGGVHFMCMFLTLNSVIQMDYEAMNHIN